MATLGLGLLRLSPDELMYMIPLAGIITGCLMVVGIVWLAVNYKQRMQEMEHQLHLRRMEHERRMKELELELARIQSGAAAVR